MPEAATNVTRQQIENLPQNDRNFLNFATLAPVSLVFNVASATRPSCHGPLRAYS